MRNRTTLTLMELLVMVLVFSLACALCLQVFAKADKISRETGLRDNAVCLAQNAAEIIKGSNGDLAETAKQLGMKKEPEMGTSEGLGVWNGYYDSSGRPVEKREAARYRLVLQQEETENTLLGRAKIDIFDTDHSGTPLFGLTVSWQEVQ